MAEYKINVHKTGSTYGQENPRGLRIRAMMFENKSLVKKTFSNGKMSCKPKSLLSLLKKNCREILTFFSAEDLAHLILCEIEDSINLSLKT